MEYFYLDIRYFIKKRGKTLSDSNLEEMDDIWNIVKKKAHIK